MTKPLSYQITVDIPSAGTILEIVKHLPDGAHEIHAKLHLTGGSASVSISYRGVKADGRVNHRRSTKRLVLGNDQAAGAMWLPSFLPHPYADDLLAFWPAVLRDRTVRYDAAMVELGGHS